MKGMTPTAVVRDEARFLNNRPGGDYGHADTTLVLLMAAEREGVLDMKGRERHEAEAYAAAYLRWRCERCGFTTARPDLHADERSSVKCWRHSYRHRFVAFDPLAEMAADYETLVAVD